MIGLSILGFEEKEGYFKIIEVGTGELMGFFIDYPEETKFINKISLNKHLCLDSEKTKTLKKLINQSKKYDLIVLITLKRELIKLKTNEIK